MKKLLPTNCTIIYGFLRLKKVVYSRRTRKNISHRKWSYCYGSSIKSFINIPKITITHTHPDHACSIDQYDTIYANKNDLYASKKSDIDDVLLPSLKPPNDPEVEKEKQIFLKLKSDDNFEIE